MYGRNKKILIISLVAITICLIAVGVFFANRLLPNGNQNNPSGQPGQEENKTPTQNDGEEPGLYFGNATTPSISWKKLIESKLITVKDNAITGSSASITGRLVIPDDVVSIAKNAFQNRTGLVGVHIGSQMTVIGSGAFSGCTGLKTLTFGSGITKIATKAFYGCTGMETLVIGENVTSIEESAFANCTMLRYVVISDSVTKIDKGAFSGCAGIVELYIGKNVTTIGENAFGWCTALKAVTISNKTSAIGVKAFQNCNALETVRYAGTEAGWGKITIGKTNDCLNNATFEYSVDTLAAKQSVLNLINPPKEEPAPESPN